MNHELDIDKYYKECNFFYNPSVEKDAFEKICCYYGLIKKDENTYILPEEKLTIVKGVDDYHYEYCEYQNLTISSKDNYIEASKIPVRGQYCESLAFFIWESHYALMQKAFFPGSFADAKIYSLSGLILFLEAIKYYGYYSTNLSREERANERENFKKRIKKFSNKSSL